MDISLNFKEAIQSTIFQHKSIEIIEKNNILNEIRKKNSFVTLVDLTCNQINKFYKIVEESRDTYQSLSNHLTNKNYVCNVEDDKTDILAQTLVNECLQSIEELKRRMTYLGIPQQNQEHNKILISIIEECLKSICKIYSEQNILKTKQAVAMRQVFKLKSWKIQTKKTNIQHFKHVSYNTKRSSNKIEGNSFEIQEINGDICQLINVDDHEQIKPKDIQLFEIENEQLYNELNILTAEMKEIENKVVSLSELQDIFSEKVLDQDKGLEHVMATIVGSTENVKEANERIRNAIQRNAGFRVWILFFILILSFSLIFLDWYKP